MVITLYEGVLNDDTLESIGGGKYRIVYHTYANEWGNNRHEKEGGVEELLDWYIREYRDRASIQGGAWRAENVEELERGA